VGQGTLIMRADAGIAMGTGHVMRCFALAQAWQDAGGHAVFAMAQATPALEERLQRESMEVARLRAEPGSADDAQETIALDRRKQARWVVVDGYCFGADYQAALKGAGLKVFFIDDNGHAAHYSADFVLNQNVHANEALYRSRDESTRLLLGPRFAMLRREFTEWRGWNREIPAVAGRVLVTMGGSDPDNLTERVVEAILAEPDVNATVVVGGSNPRLPKLRALVAGRRDAPGDVPRDVQLVENVTNMPELMANSDLAISGAGTTGLEMCFLGLPALLIVLADNQRSAAEELSRRGAAINLGEGAETSLRVLAEQLVPLLASRERRKTMSEAGRNLVDGLGAERVMAKLNAGGTE
jgi:UDP-2,4-diacetamido-2,4,6-trideoxy-beta-L-altropyranose hydrolase